MIGSTRCQHSDSFQMIKKTLKFLGVFVLASVLLLTGLLIYIIWSSNVFYQTPTFATNSKKYIRPDTTEAFVVGTVHNPTKQINIDTLYNTLERIKPDLILYEYDSTGFDSDMNLKGYFGYILPSFLAKYQTNEGAASKKYIMLNKTTVIRPYEWRLRNKWNKEKGILKTPDKIFGVLDDLLKQQKLSKTQATILKTFYELTDQLNSYADSSIYQINTPKQDSICQLRQYYQYHRIKEIIDQNNHLKEYRGFYTIYEQYWDLRNQAMAKNICNYIKLSPNKRIVILNGYFHSYYLLKELRQQQRLLNFKLININQINQHLYTSKNL